jgi:hypothetical protein
MTDQSDLPPTGEVDQIMLELGTAGSLPSPEDAARTVMIAHRRYPDALLTLMLGGFDDDPREIVDIPEARAFFAELFAILVQCPCAESLGDAIAPVSVVIMAICAGVLSRDRVVFETTSPTVH